MDIDLTNLPDDAAELQSLLVETQKNFKETQQNYESRIKLLEEQIRLLRQQMFARKSEKLAREVDNGQLLLFNEVEQVESQATEQEAVEVPAHTRRRGKRQPLPEDLPRVADPEMWPKHF